ncbi:MAG: NUDIX hydrolase [Anaerovoracaceae bacterium]|jgi:coenzyme A diphosphatase NUDT7
MDLQQIEAIFQKRRPDAVGAFHRYSVLMPLVEKDGALHLLYEKRGSEIDRQPGEVSFPGGAQEEGETPLMCAVRETMEELGVAREAVEVISKADTLYGGRDFLISSYLGRLDISQMHPSPVEVAEVFLVPLDYFLTHEPYRAEMTFQPDPDQPFPYEKIHFPQGYHWRDITYDVPIYDYQGYIIWGLTGRMTYNLVQILKGEKR